MTECQCFWCEAPALRMAPRRYGVKGACKQHLPELMASIRTWNETANVTKSVEGRAPHDHGQRKPSISSLRTSRLNHKRGNI